jgi:TetR/AcrR family transcriptional regulator of autoinduction and epiphytic fitness
MAQKSKKEHIIDQALPLFLAQGFKGSSIDMVVKQSAVSKPTVYNHFPNKAALMLAMVSRWICTHKPVIVPIGNQQSLEQFIDQVWLSADTVSFYALVIGEGWRFAEAKALFWSDFDQPWRKAMCFSWPRNDYPNPESIELLLDKHLLGRLKRR